MTYILLRLAIALIVGLCLDASLRQHIRQLWKRLLESSNKVSPSQKQPKYSHTYLTDPKNRILQARLLRILEGDIATAKRFLTQSRQMYPGQHDNWYLEKVIYDLEYASAAEQPQNNEKYSELLRMVNGDTDIADRLLQQQQNTHPGKPNVWYLEKVIYDLERDRHR